jgi:hypothetical protein
MSLFQSMKCFTAAYFVFDGVIEYSAGRAGGNM